MMETKITNNVTMQNRPPESNEGQDGDVWVVTDLNDKDIEKLKKVITVEDIAAKELKEEK